MEKKKTTPKSTKNPGKDPQMDGPFAEKDEVKKAEDNTRKGISKETK